MPDRAWVQPSQASDSALQRMVISQTLAPAAPGLSLLTALEASRITLISRCLFTVLERACDRLLCMCRSHCFDVIQTWHLRTSCRAPDNPKAMLLRSAHPECSLAADSGCRSCSRSHVLRTDMHLSGIQLELFA